MSKSKLLFLGIILLTLLGFRFLTFYQTQQLYHDGDRVFLRQTLQSEPVINGNSQQITLKTARGQQLFVKTDTATSLDFGQVITVAGIVKEKKLLTGKSMFVLYYPKITVEKEAADFLTAAAAVVRHESRQLYDGSLPPVSSALLMGIVFGIKEQYPRQFLQDLKTVGVLHVIAASGMNVSFVAGAIMFSLGKLLRRQYAVLLAIFMVIFYSFIAGFSASILRAAIMAILAFAASLFGRQNFAVLSILFTGYLMLLWQPSLLFDVSFQLSFLSTIGILLVKPLLDGGLGKLGRVGRLGLWQDATTTTAAQIVTLPVMLGVFGQYGLLSILVNVLVIWTVPVLMTLGSLALIIGFVYAPLAKLLLFLCLPFLLFFEKTVSFFGGINWT